MLDKGGPSGPSAGRVALRKLIREAPTPFLPVAGAEEPEEEEEPEEGTPEEQPEEKPKRAHYTRLYQDNSEVCITKTVEIDYEGRSYTISMLKVDGVQYIQQIISLVRLLNHEDGVPYKTSAAYCKAHPGDIREFPVAAYGKHSPEEEPPSTARVHLTTFMQYASFRDRLRRTGRHPVFLSLLTKTLDFLKKHRKFAPDYTVAQLPKVLWVSEDTGAIPARELLSAPGEVAVPEAIPVEVDGPTSQPASDAAQVRSDQERDSLVTEIARLREKDRHSQVRIEKLILLLEGMAETHVRLLQDDQYLRSWVNKLGPFWRDLVTVARMSETTEPERQAKNKSLRGLFNRVLDRVAKDPTEPGG